MRTATWMLVVVAIGAIARAEPPTGTVVVSCNESDAMLLVDGVVIVERTPAVLRLTAGTHVIEVRKAPLVAQKKVIEVADQQTIKVRFELVPPATGSDAQVGSGSAAPPATGSAAPPATGSATPPASGSAAPPATGSAAPPATGSAAPPAVGSGAPIAPLHTIAPAKPPRCTEGGREVPCAQGPRCTEGGKQVPCKKGEALPAPPPPATAPAVASGSRAVAAGSNALPEPLHASPGAALIEIATTAARAVAYIDGAPAHDAPCVLELEPGEHVVAVYAAGMLPAEAVVRVEAAKRQRVELTPSKSRTRIDVPAP